MLQAFEIWAKTGSSPTEWHALPCHLLDVGAAAEQLFDALPNHVQEAVAAWLDTTRDQAKAQVAFLAAAHDIGKANPYFQAKAVEHRERLSHLRLVAATEPAGHGQATYALLKSWLKLRTPWTGDQVASVASSIGGHHGFFYQGSQLTTLRLDAAPWQNLATELLEAVANTMGVAFLPWPESSLNPFVAWLAGFVSVADWLGSHQAMVVFRSEPVDLDDYYDQAQVRAKSLLLQLGFHRSQSSGPLTLPELLPQGVEPNPMQLLAAQVGQSDFQLAILEAPTGEGKTEAALALVDRFRADGAGLYFAMPTMATANGLVSRVDRYLDAAFPDAEERARLLHSMAWLFDTPGRVVANPGDRDQAGEAEDWFAATKRGLLAPNGIGTIDQALVGSIRVKHYFVRLFALAGKVVIIDEVHAYDLYMSDLLGVLMSWMRALGCRVVLLSATLPSSKRRELLRHWGVADAPSAAHPCLTWVTTSGETAAATFSVSRRKPLELTLVAVAEEANHPPGVDQITELVQSEGGLGALIVNSVSAAQQAFSVLTHMCAQSDIEVQLFHARYTATDRQRIEQQVLERFGKQGARNRPAILVATQVIEQSLDLDFDWMVTELAPVDLLIQRAGRLHRHRRNLEGDLQEGNADDERPNPRMQILYTKDQAKELPKRGVYKMSVLTATRDALHAGATIVSATDVSQLVEAVYGRIEAATATESHDPIADLLRAESAADAQASQIAKDVTIPLPSSCDPISLKRNELDEDDGYDHPRVAKTRLETLPSISIIIWPESSPLPPSPLSRHAKRNLVLQIVRVSAGNQVIAALLSLQQVPGGDRVKALFGVRVALTDTDGCFSAGDYKFRYTITTGLSWEKKIA